MELSLLTGVKIFLTLYDDQVPNTNNNLAPVPENSNLAMDSVPSQLGAKLI
jgi:hypothetical protein